MLWKKLKHDKRKRSEIETVQEEKAVLPTAKKEELTSTGWQDLPVEIQSLILAYVPDVTSVKSLMLLLQVDKRFKAIVSDPQFLKIFFQKFFNFLIFIFSSINYNKINIILETIISQPNIALLLFFEFFFGFFF